MLKGRILAVDDDVMVLKLLEEGLTSAGIEVQTVREATLAVPRALEFRPHLILVDRNLPVLNGAEIVRALRAFPQSASIPVAFITGDRSAGTLVRCIRSGAVDVLHKPIDVRTFTRIADLLEVHLEAPVFGPSTPESQARALLAWFRRRKSEGVLRLNPDTPFEGRALFDRGALRSAHFGPLTGITAVEEMLSFDGGTWDFQEGLPEEITDKVVDPTATPGVEEIVELAGDSPPHILLVDDDNDLRRLFQLQLQRKGFKVDVATDGREGVQMARATAYDLAVADLNMPRLDGWGMLRELRADHRTRELPVIFLSAHDDYRQTLKAARSGAWDYLPKTGKADEVIQRTLQALLPRQQVNAQLLMGEPSEVSLAVVGPRWFLRALARHKLTGVLEARDEWASYRVVVHGGVPVAARAQSGQRQSTGVAAICALLVSRGARGSFKPGHSADAQTFEHGMEQVLDLASQALNELEGRALSRRLERGGQVEVDPELYALYRRISSQRELSIARAVCEERIPLHHLATHLSLEPEDVEEGMADLLRRRVIRFSAQGLNVKG